MVCPPGSFEAIHVLCADAASLPTAAVGAGQWEAISDLRALRDLPLALTKTSASCGFLAVAKETKRTLVRAIYMNINIVSRGQALDRHGSGYV